MVVFFIFCKNDNVLYFRVCPYFNLNQVVVYVYTRTCWRRGIVVSGVRHIGDRLWAGIPSQYVTSQLGQLSLASLRGR